MLRWIRNLIFKIKYKLGLAREGVDFIIPGYDGDLDDVKSYFDGYWEAVAENCPEFWDDVYI